MGLTLEVAGRLTEAWKLRVAQRELDGKEKVGNSDAAVWVAGLLAVLDDDAAFAEAMSNQFQDLSENRVSTLLPLLVRAGKNCGGG